MCAYLPVFSYTTQKISYKVTWVEGEAKNERKDYFQSAHNLDMNTLFLQMLSLLVGFENLAMRAPQATEHDEITVCDSSR